MSSIRDTINRGDANQLAGAINQARLADIIAMLVAGSTATQAAAAVTTNALTLANATSRGGLLDVVATAGTVTGRKRIVLDATGRYLPATGEVRWNGGSGLLFAVADGVTAASVWYLRDDRVGSTIAAFERDLGDRGYSGQG